MRGSLTSLVRLSVFAGLGLCVVAVGLGRMVSPTPDLRSLGTNRLVALPIETHGDEPSPPRFLDFDGGRLETLPLAASDRLECAIGSPWKDERGESHVVGRWYSISGRGDTAIMGDAGIVRVGFPSGRVIDRVSTSIVPDSTPCWFPNASPRILFTAGDGKLYRVSFAEAEAEAGSAAVDTGDDLRMPRPVSWRDESNESHRLSDPSWPELPALGGRLIVSLRRKDVSGVDPRRKYHPSELWCLSLSPDRSWIESASRLTPSDSTEAEERFSRMGRAADGSLRLAFLTHLPGETSWRGRLATVSIDTPGGVPFVLSETLLDVADNCLPVAPNFSSDGLHVDFARRDDQGELLVKRVPLVSK